MKKKKIFLIIGGIVVLGCLVALILLIKGGSASNTNLPYYYDEENKVLTINFNTINYTKKIGSTQWDSYSEDIKKIVVNEGVTTIGANSFYNCINVKEVVLPSTLTTIGDGAFENCVDLETINIPNSVISIGLRAFTRCEKLEYYEAENAKYLGNSENPYHVLINVIDSNISTFDINPSTKIICYSAFTNCSSLTNIVIPEGVLEIGAYAFGGCQKLENVSLPNSLMNVGEQAFNELPRYAFKEYQDGLYLGNDENEYLLYCTNKKSNSGFLKKIDIHPDTMILANNLVMMSQIRELTIPSNLKTIGKYNFNEYSGLKTITINGDNPYLTLVDGVLYNKDVTELLLFPNGSENDKWIIPETVKKISEDVQFVKKTRDIYYQGTIEDWCKFNFEDSKNNPMGAGKFYMKDSKGEYVSITELTIPNGITFIGNYQFYGLTDLTKIVISKSVVGIGFGAFIADKELTKIEGAESVTHIMSMAFSNCAKLTEISNFVDLMIIEDSAFHGCSGLTNVEIPKSVINIGEGAFYECTSLESINVDSKNKYYSSDNGVLYNKDKTCLITYPATKKDTNFIFLEQIEEISPMAFANNVYIEKVELSNNITIIPAYAFYECRSLKSIEIPNSVTVIDYWAFMGCTSLKEVFIPSSVKKMGLFAFSNNHDEQVIYCEHENQPTDWSSWENAKKVVWGYKK